MSSPTQPQSRRSKFRRNGRHTTPSQVEKVAERAGKAAPAMAMGAALVAGPAITPGAAGAAATGPAAVARTHQPASGTTTATTPASASSTSKPVMATLTAKVTPVRTYRVREGDTLASIARRFYGTSRDWTGLYQANRALISDPNLIYPGQRLRVPAHPHTTSTHTTSKHGTTYRPKHAKAELTAKTRSAAPHGNLNCSGLEQLWRDAGGTAGEAAMAASIAMAESGGHQYALSPTDDRGYWQINASWGALSTYDALGNARAAIKISADGRNWTPWTTYTSGAYRGRC